jgi:MoaA/NifB/PqqE/SkfB family radical SAM enzyme
MMMAEKVPVTAVRNDLRFIWLEITAKCNLYCSHCYADSGPQVELYGNMTYGDWTRVIDEAAELGCRNIQFIGGEPTMHPRLDDLVDHANHRGFEFIEVFTNATRLGKELIGCFQRSGVHVATSFYTDDHGVHEQITQGKGSWHRTVEGIETALAAGLPIRVGVIETEQNAGHAPRAIEFLKNLGVQEIRMDRERGVGRGKLVHLGGEGERYEELCGQCWKGRLCVTNSGEVFPCVFSRATRLGDVKAGILSILQTAKLADFRHKVRSMHEGDSAGPVQQRPGCQPESCGPMDSCGPAPGTCVPNCNPPCAPLCCAPN